VGTDPVGVTIQDVNNDGIPDMLVVDRGSNDIATLFGSVVNGQWVGTPGPRLASGGSGPVAVNVVSNPHSPGGLDLVVTNGQSGNLAVLPGVGQGFFNDTSPRTVPLPAQVVQAPVPVPGLPGKVVAVTADGSLLGFNLNNADTAGIVFTPPPGAAVIAIQALSDGRLVAVETGGLVEVLGPSPGSAQFEAEQTLAPLTGIPSEPSALAVLESEPSLEVLVTNQGEDRLFVFGVALPGTSLSPALAQVVVLPPLPEPTGPVAEATAPSAAPLVLVVTLLAGTLPTGEPTPAGTAAPAVPIPDVGGPNLVNAAPAVDPAGNAEDDEAQPSADTSGESDPLGIWDILRQLKLYRNPDEQDGNDPMSGALPAREPDRGGDAQTVFWQAVAAEQSLVANGLDAQAEGSGMAMVRDRVLSFEPDGTEATGSLAMEPVSAKGAVLMASAAADRLPGVSETWAAHAAWGPMLLVWLAGAGQTVTVPPRSRPGLRGLARKPYGGG
jgi:hypothetical protein